MGVTRTRVPPTRRGRTSCLCASRTRDTRTFYQEKVQQGHRAQSGVLQCDNQSDTEGMNAKDNQ